MNDFVTRNTPRGEATWMHRTGTDATSRTTSMARKRWKRAPVGLLASELARQPEDRTVRRELDSVLRPVIDAVERRPTDGLDRAEAKARGEFDDAVREILVGARELAPPGDIVDEAVGVHQPLEQGQTLRDPGFRYGRGMYLPSMQAEVAQPARKRGVPLVAAAARSPRAPGAADADRGTARTGAAGPGSRRR